VLLAALPLHAVNAADDEWAWAVVRKPGSSYHLTDARDRGSSGGAIRVKRFRRGVWVVHFKGIDASLEEISDESGVVLLTPLTKTSAICSVNSWARKPLSVTVRCIDRRGDRVDVGFIVHYLGIRSSTPTMGNVWSNLHSGDYTPRVAGNSSGGAVTIDQTATGRYSTSWAGIGFRGGNGQANAINRFRVCVLELWLPVGGDERLDVACRDKRGGDKDSQFSAAFTRGVGLKGDGGGAWAYLVADQPTTASYVPQLLLQGSSPAITASVVRLGKGRYRVKLPGMPRGGAAQVTAVLGNAQRCNIDSIRKKGSLQRIGVRCFNARGTKPRDAVFSLSYTK
jgi:hypothetical protein